MLSALFQTLHGPILGEWTLGGIHGAEVSRVGLEKGGQGRRRAWGAGVKWEAGRTGALGVVCI